MIESHLKIVEYFLKVDNGNFKAAKRNILVVKCYQKVVIPI